MSIKMFNMEEVIDYYPNYNNNKENKNPCVVKLNFVPYSKVQHYSRLIASRTKGINDPSRVTELTQSVQRKQFVDNVGSVRGYFVGGEEVTSAGVVYDTADTEFVIEIIRAMESASVLSSQGNIKHK